MLYLDQHYRTEGTVRSSSVPDLEAMRQVFYSYRYDWSVRYFTDQNWEEVSEEEASFSADGPFGVSCLDDIDVFRDMAAAAPEAYMEASTEDMYPYDSYTCLKEKLRCRLENGVLTTELTTITRDSEDYRYEDYIVEILPYKKYTELFGIEPGSLAEEDYPAFVDSLTRRCWENPLALDFEEFTRLLARFSGKTTLNGKTYDDACEKAEAAGLISLGDFMDKISKTETEIFRIDAKTGRSLSL